MTSVTAPAIEQTAPQNAPKIASNHVSKTIASNATAQLAKQPIASKKAPNSRTRRQSNKGSEKKLFVLDTNVMLHDPSCLFRFEEHDVTSR